jgi:aminoglycoside-2''-adenylyltransferase
VTLDNCVAVVGPVRQPRRVIDSSPPVPGPVAYVRDLLNGLAAPWFLSGGWAADAWLGRQTREHGDVDITVFHDDQQAIFEHLSGWALVAHDPTVADDTTEQWSGRRLELPAHIHVPTAGSALATSAGRIHTEVEFEFMLNERTGERWVLNPEAGIDVPLELSTRHSGWGLPTAPPEIVIFFKAGANLTAAEIATWGGMPRSRDEQDLLALLPILPDAARAWLHRSIAVVQPRHPWLDHLMSS